MCLMMAQNGQVKQAITDSYLKQMLESITEQGGDEAKGGVSFDRRRFADDSDDELDLEGL